MYKKNRIGLVGCGEWGKNILRDLVNLGAEVHVFAHSEKTAKRAVDNGAFEVYAKMTNLPELDGYIIATPTEIHAESIKSILSINPNALIFTEKPMCPDPEIAKELAKIAKNNLFVMDKWRYHPGVLAMKKITNEKILGQTQGLKTKRVGWGFLHNDVDSIWHLAPHDLSIFLEIFGYLPEPKSSVIEKVDGKATGMIAVLGSSPFLTIEVSSTSPTRQRQLILYCENGIAVLNDAYSKGIEIYKTKGTLSSRDEVPVSEFIEISDELPLFAELKAIMEFINGGESPRSNAKDGAAIVSVLSKLRKTGGIK